MRIVLVDALDSFTHNLAQAFGALGAEVCVVSTHTIDASGIALLDPALCVFGPGPGSPEDSGCHVPAIRALCGRMPILGVCLGHQALALALGGSLLRHPPVHGHPSAVHHDRSGIFGGLPAAVPMGRYHSLGVDPATLPACLRVTARTDDGVVMGIAHRSAPAWGVQFHPESVMSGAPGLQLLANAMLAAVVGRSRAQPRTDRQALDPQLHRAI